MTLEETLRAYSDQLLAMANDDEISADGTISLKAMELRYMIRGRLLELENGDV